MGGAALVLRWGARETTYDVDAFVVDPTAARAVRAAAARAAESLRLPADWLNDAAKGFVHGLAVGDVLIRTERLIIRALATEQLLAMKLCAWRDDVDIADATLLLEHLASEDRASTWAQVVPYLVPGCELKAQYAFEDLWEATRGPA